MKNKPMKILIIEDEKILADILGDKLTKEGYQVNITYNGASGYKEIKKWHPDLILLDVIIPKIDGYEVLEKLKKDKIKTPVIIISNSGGLIELEKTKKLGAVDWLVKAKFDSREVLDKVCLSLKKCKVKPLDLKVKAGKKILVVEDEPFLRELCVKKLTKEGFTVFEAIDGGQVLYEMEKYQPDLVLLDIVLPNINGFKVLEKIRNHKNKTIKKTPVIVLSNLGQKQEIKKAMDLGANDFLIKAHFSPSDIIKKIKVFQAAQKKKKK